MNLRKAKFRSLFLIMFFILKINSQACSNGCLKCEKGQCVFCDYTRYILKEGSCLELTEEIMISLFPNCLTISFDGVCEECSKNHFLNDLKICEKTQIKIAKCLDYESEGKEIKCKKCYKGYLLIDNQCKKIENPIENCIDYFSNFTCKQCENLYYLSQDNNACIRKSKELERCKTFSYIECQSCATCDNEQESCNMIEMNSSQSLVYEIEKNTKEFISEFFSDNTNQNKDFTYCFKTIENCEKINEDFICEKCENGFFLENNSCHSQKQSEEQENCTIFDKECLMCADSYVLKDKKCVSVEALPNYPIPNCSKYSSYLQQENLQCLKCSSGEFALVGYECVEKVKLIITEDCETYTKNDRGAVECNQCLQNFSLSPHKKCYKNITHCEDHFFQNYFEENRLIEFISCKECIPEFYVDTERNKCQSGTIPNCHIYKQISEKSSCLQCKERFYLKDGECYEHQFYQLCSRYHFELKDICSEGKDNWLPAQKKFQCQPLPETKQQTLIDSKCLNSPQISFLDLDCQSCTDHSIPFNTKNSVICISTQQINQPIENCKIHTTKINELVCALCQDNFYYDQEQKKCLQNSNCSKTLVKNYLNSFQNTTCETVEDANCFYAHKIQKSDDVQIFCQKCKNEFLQVFDPLQPYIKIESVSLEFLNLESQNLILSLTEQQILKLKCIENIQIPNCEYYVQPNTCVKCSEGYFLQKGVCIFEPASCMEQKVFGLNWKFQVYKICQCQENENPALHFPIQNILKPFQIYDKAEVKSSCSLKANSKIENCFLNLIFSGKSNSYTINLCGACENGFNPVYSKINPDIIIKCERIEQCKLNFVKDELNQCSECEDFHSFWIDQNVLQNTCKKMTLDNCFIQKDSQSCLYCKEGYFKVNNQCIKFDTLNCEHMEQKTKFLVKDFNFKIFLNQMIQSGCQSCSDGKIKFYENQQKYKCGYFTSYHKSLINFCQQYKIESHLVSCQECQQDYQLREQRCIQMTNNCKIFDSSQQTCLKCQENYYLYEKQCFPFQVKNCQKYLLEECIKCKPGFALILLSDRQFCLPSSFQNCEDLKVVRKNDLFFLNCDQCRSDYILEEAQSQVFLQLDVIQHCAQFNQVEFMQSKKLICSKCLENNNNSHDLFFLEEGQCLTRKQDDGCLVYEKLENNCSPKGCKEGYEYQDTLKLCIEKPKIFNCEIFISFNECGKCFKNYYLVECFPDHQQCRENNLKNFCQPVSEEKLIQNCAYYDVNQACLECKKDSNQTYMLVQNEQGEKRCIISEAQNCKTQMEKKECQTCFSGFYLEPSKEDITNCVKNDEENCVFYEEYFLSLDQNKFKSGHCSYCMNDEALFNAFPKGRCITLENRQKIKNCQLHSIDQED